MKWKVDTWVIIISVTQKFGKKGGHNVPPAQKLNSKAPPLYRFKVGLIQQNDKE